MKTLVLIRGWASLDDTFSHLIETKPADIEIHIIAAEELIPDLNIQNSVDSLQNIIEQKKINNFTLVGHSLGGAIAIAYSVKYPSTHSNLILVNSVGVPQSGSTASESIKLLKQNILKPVRQWPAKLKEGANVLKNPIFQTKLGHFSRKINLLAVAENIEKPTLILHGDKDILVPLENSRALQRVIPKSRITVINNVDHDWISVYPEKFWEAIAKQ